LQSLRENGARNKANLLEERKEFAGKAQMPEVSRKNLTTLFDFILSSEFQMICGAGKTS
jgi:hypothetical protein